MRMDKQDDKVLLSVRHLHKKFCTDLKYLMFYGFVDLSKAFFNRIEKREKLRKYEFWAVKDISLDFFENDITALVGVNGSGKTSLIRMLAGIYDTDRGDVEYASSVRSVVSIFAIKSGLHSTLSGRENIYLKSAYYGCSKKEVDDKLDFIIEFAGVGTNIDSPLGNYSSGMKTRLAMAIALSIDSDILFIDEGFSFSDPGFKLKCFDFLKSKFSQSNKTLVFATHQLGKITDLANRIVLMNKGEILLDTKDVDHGIREYLKICN